MTRSGTTFVLRQNCLCHESPFGGKGCLPGSRAAVSLIPSIISLAQPQPLHWLRLAYVAVEKRCQRLWLRWAIRSRWCLHHSSPSAHPAPRNTSNYYKWVGDRRSKDAGFPRDLQSLIFWKGNSRRGRQHKGALIGYCCLTRRSLQGVVVLIWLMKWGASKGGQLATSRGRPGLLPPLSTNSRHSCQIIVYDEMNACGHVGRRRLMDGLLMTEIISLVIAGSRVCQVPVGGLTSQRPGALYLQAGVWQLPKIIWINTVPSPDIIKLPMQICLSRWYLNDTRECPGNETRAQWVEWRHGPCAGSREHFPQ